MTDIHLNQDSSVHNRFTKAISHINTLQSDFVIAGGDLIMNNPGTTYESVKQQYQYYLDLIQSFTMPVYPTIGNHNIVGIYQPLDFSKDHPDYGKKMYLRLFNLTRSYYSFNHKGWHIVILDDIRIIGDQ